MNSENLLVRIAANALIGLLLGAIPIGLLGAIFAGWNGLANGAIFGGTFGLMFGLGMLSTWEAVDWVNGLARNIWRREHEDSEF